MAVTVTNVLAGGGAPSAGANTTASWTPDGTSQYILSIACYVSTGSVNPVVSSISGNGLTWTQLGTTNGDNTGADRTTQYMFAVPAGGSAGTITINWSTAPTRASWTLDKVAGADSGLGSGTLPQAAATGTSSGANPSATLANALQTNSVSYAAADFESSSGSLSAGSGYTALGTDTSQSLSWIISEWNSAGSTSASASNSTTANRHSIILIEIAVASTGTNAPAESPSATGTAQDATAALTANAEQPTSTGAAQDATSALTTNAQQPTGAGVAADGTGSVGVQPTTPGGTGTAGDGNSAITVNAESPTGTGTAFDATVSISGSTSAPAEAALGTGTAGDAVAAIVANAQVPTGAGVAADGTGSLGVNAESPTASGASLDAQGAVATSAQGATATGVAGDGTGSVTTSPTSADGFGTAFDATVTVYAVGAAIAAAQAFDAAVQIVQPQITRKADIRVVTGGHRIKTTTRAGQIEVVTGMLQRVTVG